MTDQPKESAIEQVITKFIETACVLGISVENGSIVLQARAELAAKDAELAELRAKLADLEGIDKVCDAAHEQIVLLQNDVDTLQAKLQPLACGHLAVDLIADQRTEQCDRLRHSIGYSLCPACIPGYCRRCRELEQARSKYVETFIRYIWQTMEQPM